MHSLIISFDKYSTFAILASHVVNISPYFQEAERTRPTLVKNVMNDQIILKCDGAGQVENAWRAEKLEDLPDPNLGGHLNSEEFVKLVELSLWCARKRNEERPFMRQVVQNLRENIGLAPMEMSKPEIDFLDVEEEDPLDITSDSAPFSKSSSFSIISNSTGLTADVRLPCMPFRRAPSLPHSDLSR